MGSDEMTQLGARVRTERFRRDITQSHLAEIAGLDRSALNRIETGERRLSALELARIAEALGVSMAAFFRSPAPSIVSYRAANDADASRSSIDEHLEEVATDVELVQRLGALECMAPGPARHPTDFASAEAMAASYRNDAGLGDEEPFTAIARHASDIGLMIFSYDLGQDAPDAGTALLESGGVTVINSQRKIGRRRLAAVHEIGHYLVQDEYTVDWRTAHSTHTDVEGLLDAFARAVLLPGKALERAWAQATRDADLRTAAILLASRFQVDMSTLAQRLTEREVLSAADAGTVRLVRTTQSDMVEFDLYAPPEEFAGQTQPRAYQQAVLALVRNRSISREKAISLLAGTFELDDLPGPDLRSEHEIWQFVS